MLKLPFKNLKIWQLSFSLVKEIYLITNAFPKEEIYGLTSQIRRSAVSIPSNIAEGSQRSSNKDFANFILISKGSLAELETQLLLSHEIDYISYEQLVKLMLKIEELNKMIFSFYNSLLKTNH